jgi:PncC family amidohydrolase
MLPPETLEQAELLLQILQSRGITLATAESCTGGLVAAAVTAIPGSSATLLGGYVTYSNEAKAKSVGVDPALIARLGAVSGEVAAAMAEGAARESGAAMGISTTGIAGPGGGTEDKPVGTVCFSVMLADGPRLTRTLLLPGNRSDVRERSTTVAMHLLRRALLGAKDHALLED